MKKKKQFKSLKTDRAAIDEVSDIDLSEYDLSQFKPVAFEFQTKSDRLELRIPEEQLALLKTLAKREGIPYTRLARRLIDQGMQALER